MFIFYLIELTDKLLHFIIQFDMIIGHVTKQNGRTKPQSLMS